MLPSTTGLLISVAFTGAPPATFVPAASVPDSWVVSGDGLAVVGALGRGAGVMVGVDAPAHPRVAVRAQGVGSSLLSGGVASLRVAAINQDAIVLSPWVQVVGTGSEDVDVFGMAGLAVDAGGERVRLDISVPVVAVPAGLSGALGTGLGAGLFVGEAGVRGAIGERDSLRLGLLGVQPGLDWQHQIGERGATVNLGAHSAIVAHSLRLGFTRPL